MPRVMAETPRGLPTTSSSSMKASPRASIWRAPSTSRLGDYFSGRGGGIGQGLAGAIGVEGRDADRPVVARLRRRLGDVLRSRRCGLRRTTSLPIVFVVLANREYRVLKHNVDVWRQNFEAGTSIPIRIWISTGPALDFVHLAAGMGVEAVRVENADDIAGAVAKAVAANQPYLVEIAIEGKR